MVGLIYSIEEKAMDVVVTQSSLLRFSWVWIKMYTGMSIKGSAISVGQVRRVSLKVFRIVLGPTFLKIRTWPAPQLSH